MAHYSPDYELRKATKLIESLDDSEDSKLIRYYIGKQEEWSQKQEKKLKEYRDFFDKMRYFVNL